MRVVSRDPSARAAVAALAAATVVAWVGLVAYEPGMGLAPFLLGWTLMMAAMMLPSIAPLVLLYRRSRVGMAAGYLAVWSAVGLVPYVATDRELDPALPLVLALAGIYEFSPLTSACLRRCRNPAAFLMDHYRSGPFRLGVQHGLWCLGCCVGLMAVLVFAAAMALPWAVAIALVVFVQKVLVGGELWARVIGIALLAAAIVAAAV